MHTPASSSSVHHGGVDVGPPPGIGVVRGQPESGAPGVAGAAAQSLLEGVPSRQNKNVKGRVNGVSSGSQRLYVLTTVLTAQNKRR